MWRALFLAVGITLCITGGEFLLIDKATLAKPAAAATNSQGNGGQQADVRDFKPPEWAPWSLLSTGSVIILYSFTIPRRVAG